MDWRQAGDKWTGYQLGKQVATIARVGKIWEVEAGAMWPYWAGTIAMVRGEVEKHLAAVNKVTEHRSQHG